MMGIISRFLTTAVVPQHCLDPSSARDSASTPDRGACGIKAPRPKAPIFITDARFEAARQARSIRMPPSNALLLRNSSRSSLSTRGRPCRQRRRGRIIAESAIDDGQRPGVLGLIKHVVEGA